MRIVVSGTHASGKSTLVSDFSLRHPEFTVLPDPFEMIDEAEDAPGSALFTSQFRVATRRLTSETHGGNVIAERGPLDFLAYLLALADTAGTSVDDDVRERATTLAREAMDTVDLLVVLPLTASDPIRVGEDEYRELRAAMNDVLLDLIDDPEVVGGDLRIAEITGTPETRLRALEKLAGFPHASA